MKRNNDIRINTSNGEVKVTVRPYISLVEQTQLVRSVVASLFGKEDDYLPELRPFVEALQVITSFTDFEMSDGEAITDEVAEMLGEVLYGSNIYSRILESISPEQLFDIKEAIDRGVKFRCKMIRSTERAKLEQVTHELDRGVQTFKRFCEQFSDVDPKQLFDIFSKVTDMDEDSIVKGVIKAQDEQSVAKPVLLESEPKQK